jgi:dipeptidyl-peptidase-4
VNNPAPAATFPIEAIAEHPAPGLGVPSAFRFSQDDQRLTYLLGTGRPPVQRLYALDVATGAATVLAGADERATASDRLTPEEELRRQRARQIASGIAQYGGADHADRLIIPLAGGIGALDALDAPGAAVREVVAGGDSPCLTPALSPDGAWIAYVRDAELYVVPAAGGAPIQVTHGAREAGTTHGLAEYVAQEELNRQVGFWWSPDGERLAYTELDERQIPTYRIVHQGKSGTGPDAWEEHRYAFAGGPNARVRLAVVPRAGGEPVWMDLGADAEAYLARVFWWPEGSLGVVLLARDQLTAEVLRLDPATGARALLLRETTTTWINLVREPAVPLADGGFLWHSERSGFRHLYHYDASGALLRQVTSGDWMVDELKAVDEPAGAVYFTGTRDDPREAHLYHVALGDGVVRRITTEPGGHDAFIDHAGRHFVDVWSALDHPPSVRVRALADGAVVSTVALPPDPRVAAFHLAPPELVALTNRAGDTLYGAVYRPPERFGPGPHPTIVAVYGGPHAQTVVNAWALTAALQLQYLRGQGYLIFRLDNRGSARRGMAFERALRHQMGTVEVDDQVDGVRWLVEQGLADPARVGVTGWSYGGYMTLLCLARAPEVFSVGVAGAPVTSWDGYDTAYTERYMGTPTGNPAGYAGGSVLEQVGGIRGKLLVIHGMLDENVHFRHTARLINALNRARKAYDVLLFPDERHMPRLAADRVYLNERIVEYFRTHL